jgi:predicted acyl esterase
MEEPKLRVFLPEAQRPRPASLPRRGIWLAEPGWPTPNVAERTFWPASRAQLVTGEVARDVPATALPLPLTQAVGMAAGPWCGYGGPLDNPSDQRAEDARSLCFDSEPLEEELPLLGHPRAVLELESDQPFGQVAVRLCDVWADGASTLVTRGMLNLSHRHSHEHPEPSSSTPPATASRRAIGCVWLSLRATSR